MFLGKKRLKNHCYCAFKKSGTFLENKQHYFGASVICLLEGDTLIQAENNVPLGENLL